MLTGVCPTVRNQEVEDGWVVGDLRTSPAHHQRTAVHMLHLHVNGSAAAYWKDDRAGVKREEEEKEGNDIKRKIRQERNMRYQKRIYRKRRNRRM